jgi:hypothetical protein
MPCLRRTTVKQSLLQIHLTSFDIWYRSTSDIVPTTITGDMHSVNKANTATPAAFFAENYRPPVHHDRRQGAFYPGLFGVPCAPKFDETTVSPLLPRFCG